MCYEQMNHIWKKKRENECFLNDILWHFDLFEGISFFPNIYINYQRS